MKYIYAPDIAAKAVLELNHALRGHNDMEYANALLADQRMTNTKGVLASCGVKYKDIKRVRDCVSGQLPTLDAQKKALEFLNGIDAEQELWSQH
tara:strand:- start:158 stop:439 length:282 start_codon:yes stop_codon:yes gene_type:complete